MANIGKNYELGAFYMYDLKPSPPKSRYRIVNYVKKKLRIGVRNPEDKRKAIVQKSGHYRIKYTGLKPLRGQFFKDLYVTLIDLQWRYVLAILFNVCLACYFVFAIMWYWLMANHGDFNHLHDKNWKTCIHGVESFAGTLLFSMETQTSIGYGYTYINSECPGALILLFVQVVVGLLTENLLLGFIFAKFAQPKRRQKTLMFSKTAVVNQEDGQMCVQIRVGDMRQSHLLDARVHGVLVKKHVTNEGVVYPLYLKDVDFKAHGMTEKIVLMWPLILSHKITPESPFWNMKPSDLMSERYELVIYIEGTIESTGEFCQSRTSYLPSEILWGHRFDRIEEFDAGNGRWEIDFEGFHDIVYCTNIRHSAHELYDMKTQPTQTDKEAESNKNLRKKAPSPPLTVCMHNISYDTPLNAAENNSPTEEEEIIPEFTSDEERVPLQRSFFDPKDDKFFDPKEDNDDEGIKEHDIISRQSPEIHQDTNNIVEERDLGDGVLKRIQEEDEDSVNATRSKGRNYESTDDDLDEYVST